MIDPSDLEIGDLNRDSEKHKIIAVRDGNGDITYRVTCDTDGLVDVRSLQACADLASLSIQKRYQRKERMKWLSPWMKIVLACVVTLAIIMFAALLDTLLSSGNAAIADTIVTITTIVATATIVIAVDKLI